MTASFGIFVRYLVTKRLTDVHLPIKEVNLISEYYGKMERLLTKPLKIFCRDAPVECAIYAQENNLLDTQEWKRFRRLAQRHHLLNERSALRLPQVLWSALKSTLPFLEALFLSLTFMDFSLISPYVLYVAGSFASYAAVPMNAICLHPLRGILMMGSEKFDKTEVLDVSRDPLFWMHD